MCWAVCYATKFDSNAWLSHWKMLDFMCISWRYHRWYIISKCQSKSKYDGTLAKCCTGLFNHQRVKSIDIIFIRTRFNRAIRNVTLNVNRYFCVCFVVFRFVNEFNANFAVILTNNYWWARSTVWSALIILLKQLVEYGFISSPTISAKKTHLLNFTNEIIPLGFFLVGS